MQCIIIYPTLHAVHCTSLMTTYCILTHKHSTVYTMTLIDQGIHKLDLHGVVLYTSKNILVHVFGFCSPYRSFMVISISSIFFLSTRREQHRPFLHIQNQKLYSPSVCKHNEFVFLGALDVFIHAWHDNRRTVRLKKIIMWYTSGTDLCTYLCIIYCG